MARVLITGVAGFLGAHLAARLSADGHAVGGVDNLLGGEWRNIPAHLQPACECLDCCDLKEMQYYFRAFKPEVVYHLAAAPHEGLSVFSPAVVSLNTYQSTVAVAAAACAVGVRRFVFTSSMARYGHGWVTRKAPVVPGQGAGFEPFREEMEPRPVDPYGVAKVAAEQALRVLGRQHGMEVVILVPHNIAGELQRYTDPYRNVAAIFINRMLQGKQPVIYGDGEQRRVFSYVGDCVDVIVKAGFQEGLDGEVVNIGPDSDPVTINFLARALYDIIGGGKDLPDGFKPVYLPARPCEVKDAWPSSDKARRLFGFEAKTPLGVILARMVEDIRRRGPKPFVYHLPLEIPTPKTPRTWLEKLF